MYDRDIVFFWMTIELERVPTAENVQFACRYLEALAIRGITCVLPDRELHLSIPENSPGDIEISIFKPHTNHIATLQFPRSLSPTPVTPVITVSRPNADKDLVLFGVVLPKFHPDKADEGDSLVGLHGLNAQQLLVGLSQAMQHQGARLVSQDL